VSVRLGAALMAVLLLLYLGLVGALAVRLVVVDDPVARGLGIALIVLPLLGGWALIAEVLFGLRSERLGRIVAAEGELPADALPRRPSGRPVRADAMAAFPPYQEAVEAEPESWRAWFRLGLAYDAAGDRRRARGAIRRAIRLSRQSAEPA